MKSANDGKSIVLLVGAYPPPVGGVSIHVRRLAQLLQDWGQACAVVDPYAAATPADPAFVSRVGPGGVRALLATRRQIGRSTAAVVHFHVASMRRFVWGGPLLLAAVSGRSVLTIHSGSFAADLRAQGVVQRQWLLRLLRRFDHVITVNEPQRSTLIEHGVDRSKTQCSAAYLPAPAGGEVDIALPSGPFVLSSGYGIPLYGYEGLIEALARHPDRRMPLVLCLYNDIDESYVAEIERLAAGRVALTVCRDLDESTYAGILARARVYVRATDRDGDSIAVREALAAGIPVIATDVVPRPDGVRLYRRGDAEALTTEIARAVNGEGAAARLAPLRSVQRVFEVAYDCEFRKV